MKDKNVEEVLYLNAYSLHIAEVDDIISDVVIMADILEQKLSDVGRGKGCDEAIEALNQFADVLISGRINQFASKNRWLKAKQAEFVSEPSGTPDQSEEDRRAVYELFRISMQSDLTNAIFKVFTDLSADALKSVGKFQAFKNKMTIRCEDELIKKIVKAYEEYASMFKRYNDASIYNDKTLDVSKSAHTFEENYQNVLGHMNQSILGESCLDILITGSLQSSPRGNNALHCLDRDTANFKNYASQRDRLATIKNEAEQIEKKCGDLKKANMYVSGYYGSLKSLFNVIYNLMDSVIYDIDNFRSNSSDAPYMAMHYNGLIPRVASAFLMTSVDDPVNVGTKYNELAKRMHSRLQELARSVAKAAP